jgi:phosphate transport system protein
MQPTRERYQHELALLERELHALGLAADEAIKRAVWALHQRATREAQAIIRDDETLDDAAAALMEHALRVIALQGPVASELRLVSSLLHFARELERIGDYCKGIASLVMRFADLPAIELPPQIDQMAAEARSMLKEALDALVQRDADVRRRLKERDHVVDNLYETLLQSTVATMQADPALVLPGTYLLWVSHNLERIADRATNIGKYVSFIVEGKLP